MSGRPEDQFDGSAFEMSPIKGSRFHLLHLNRRGVLALGGTVLAASSLALVSRLFTSIIPERSASAAITKSTRNGVEFRGFGAPITQAELSSLVTDVNGDLGNRMAADAYINRAGTYAGWWAIRQADYDNFAVVNGFSVESYLQILAQQARSILKNVTPSLLTSSDDPSTITKGYQTAGVWIVDQAAHDELSSLKDYDKPNGFKNFGLQYSGISVLPGTAFYTDGSGRYAESPNDDDLRQLFINILRLRDPSHQNLSSSQIDASLKARMNPALQSYKAVNRTDIYANSIIADPAGVSIGEHEAKELASRGGQNLNPDIAMMSVIFSSDSPVNITLDPNNSFFDKDGNLVVVDPTSIKIYLPKETTVPTSTPIVGSEDNINRFSKHLYDSPDFVGQTVFTADQLMPKTTFNSQDGLPKGVKWGLALVETDQGMMYVTIQDFNIIYWDNTGATVVTDVRLKGRLIKLTDNISGNLLSTAQWRKTFDILATVTAPTATPSVTATNTRTASPTASASSSATGTATGSATASASPSETGSATASPSETGSVTASPSPSATETDTASPTASATATASASPSETGTPTSSATPSETNTATLTPSSTATPSASATSSATSSETGTATLTVSPSITPSRTNTPASSGGGGGGGAPAGGGGSGPGNPQPEATNTALPSPTITRTPSRTITVPPTRTITRTPVVKEGPLMGRKIFFPLGLRNNRDVFSPLNRNGR